MADGGSYLDFENIKNKAKTADVGTPDPKKSMIFFMMLSLIYGIFVSTTILSSTSIEQVEENSTNFIFILIYILLLIIGMYFLNLNIAKSICQNDTAQYSNVFFATILPWIIVFGILYFILEIFTGWVRPFSNTIGYVVVSLLGVEEQKRGYEPLLPEIGFIPFNHLESLSRITTSTAAVVLETIQGGAGFIVPENDYLFAVKERCEAVGALLILDEIQPGIGRTGKLFAFEHYRITPDILVIGKGLGGGMPIGAFCSSAENMEQLTHSPALGHITTFGGHPVIAAAGLATLSTVLKKKLMGQIAEKEALFRSLLQHPKILAIHGKGLLLAPILENEQQVPEVVKRCVDKGLILFFLLWEKRAIRISPPLTISHREIKKGCAILLSVLNELE